MASYVNNPAPTAIPLQGGALTYTNAALFSWGRNIAIAFGSDTLAALYSDNDLAGMVVMTGTSSGLSYPDDVVYEGKIENTVFYTEANPETQYYIQVAPFDDFGKDDLTWSDEVTVTAQQVVNSEIKTVAASKLTSGAIATGQKIYTGAGDYGDASTDFFVGFDGKFSLGEKFTWDGSVLTIDGGITSTFGSIGGWSIKSDSIEKPNFKLQSTAERILIGAATGPLSGTGVFIGKDGGDYELRVGNTTTAYMHWDGTRLIMKGDVKSNYHQSGSAELVTYGVSVADMGSYLKLTVEDSTGAKSSSGMLWVDGHIEPYTSITGNVISLTYDNGHTTGSIAGKPVVFLAADTGYNSVIMAPDGNLYWAGETGGYQSTDAILRIGTNKPVGAIQDGVINVDINRSGKYAAEFYNQNSSGHGIKATGGANEGAYAGYFAGDVNTTGKYLVNIGHDIPASAGATGTQGAVVVDSNYIYVCVATNTWKRTALSSW